MKASSNLLQTLTLLCFATRTARRRSEDEKQLNPLHDSLPFPTPRVKSLPSGWKSWCPFLLELYTVSFPYFEQM
ncbi:hypothetical protein FKM82_011059 [Ascaphus truei]